MSVTANDQKESFNQNLLPNPSLKSVPVLNISAFEGEEIIEKNPQIDSATEQEKERVLDDFDKYRVTKEKFVADNPASITIGPAKVAAPQNITPITAESKAGKTAIKNVFIAGSISRDGNVEVYTPEHGNPPIPFYGNPSFRAW